MAPWTLTRTFLSSIASSSGNGSRWLCSALVANSVKTEHTQDEEYGDIGVRQQAHAMHGEMRAYWEQRYDGEFDPKLLEHLSRILYIKRKPVVPVENEFAGAAQPGLNHDSAFASQAETFQAIVSVLQLRQSFLDFKGITDHQRVLTEAERKELVDGARRAYEETEEQVGMQQNDVIAWHELRKDISKGAGEGKGKGGTKGAGKGKGKGRGASQRAKGSGLESLHNYLHQQRRKRWCRHQQRVCGTKQLWEVLAFSGRFDLELLQQLQGRAAWRPGRRPSQARP